MTIRHFIVHAPVNTSGNETMIEGIRRRLTEINEMGDVEMLNAIHIYETVRK